MDHGHIMRDWAAAHATHVAEGVHHMRHLITISIVATGYAVCNIATDETSHPPAPGCAPSTTINVYYIGIY